MKKNNFLKFKKIFFFLLFITGGFFVFGVGEASAATWYVSTIGTDDGSHGGSSGSGAWKTLDYALTGSRIHQGDTVNIEAGVYDEFYGSNTYVNTSLGAGSGATIIQAYPSGASVAINIPFADNVGLFIYIRNGNNLQFKGISFTNTHAVNAQFFRFYDGGSLTLTQGSLDMGNGSTYLITFNDSTNDESLLIEQCKLKSNDSSHAIILDQKATGNGPTITIKSSVSIAASPLIYLLQKGDVTLINNTLIGTRDGAGGISVGAAGNHIVYKNNIFQTTNQTNYQALFHFGSGAPTTDLLNNPNNYVISNNILYIPNALEHDYDTIISGNSLIPLGTTNYWIDPQFNDSSSEDYSISSSGPCYFAGLGDSSMLPATDINGNTWSGADIGAYALSTATPYTLSLTNDVAFSGDSIMTGYAATIGNAASDEFTDLTGVQNIGLSNGAIGGLGVSGFNFLLDQVALIYKPKTIFVSIGLNDLKGTTASNFTNAQLATEIESNLVKIKNWGITPIWLGIESLAGVSPDNTRVISVNDLVNTWCEANEVAHGSILDQMTNNVNWRLQYEQGGYYGCVDLENCSNVGSTLATDVHPNNAGQALIAELAEYLYFNNHTISTDHVNVGAGARIYADGKFRDLETANGETADLSITPQSSFNIDDKSHWLDITDITWDDTKEWTESSTNSSLTNTLHTIGDLTPNNYYNVSVDNTLGNNITGANCVNGICKADSNGKIVFTYTGTYSEHTFKVEAGDNSNPILTNNTNNKFNVKTTSVNLNLTTDENSTCHYSNNSNYTFNNSTPFTTTGETNHTTQLINLVTGSYTYYAICRDSNSNESTYTLTFEIAPEELKENISSPIIKTSEGKEKMKSGSTVYSDEKEIKLQGEDIKLANGTIKIYRNSKLIKTIQADSNGKWNGKIKLSSDFSGYLKVKQYNEYGTLISEKKTKVKVDNEKPKFTSFPKNQTLVTGGKTKLTFLATDNNKVTEYKIYLGGYIYKTKTNSFTIPAKTESGFQYLRIRAYDKAGNSSYKETFVLVR